MESRPLAVYRVESIEIYGVQDVLYCFQYGTITRDQLMIVYTLTGTPYRV